MPNKYKWHIVVVPEDEATRQLGNGLSNAFPSIVNRIKFLREAGGWADAIATVKDLELDKYSDRRVLLIIDLDQDDTRLGFIRSQPEISKFNNRIFILGSFKAVEQLKPIGESHNLENVGQRLGEDCSCWNDSLLIACREDACRLKAEIENIRD